jgi:hypothetical protein
MRMRHLDTDIRLAFIPVNVAGQGEVGDLSKKNRNRNFQIFNQLQKGNRQHIHFHLESTRRVRLLCDRCQPF